VNDKGHPTGWTALLIVAGFALAIAGGVLAPDSLPVYMLVGAWGLTLTAANNIFRTVRAKADEHQIRADERARITGFPPQDER
jgi:hypothetical protein